jgi:hypothetical protein
MVALISRDGQFSACTVAATKKLAKTHINRMDLNRIDLNRIDLNRTDLRINRSGFVSGPVARTLQETYRVLPLSACGRRKRSSLPEFPDPEIDNAVAVLGHQHAIGLGGKLDDYPAVVELIRHPSVGA